MIIRKRHVLVHLKPLYSLVGFNIVGPLEVGMYYTAPSRNEKITGKIFWAKAVFLGDVRVLASVVTWVWHKFCLRTGRLWMGWNAWVMLQITSSRYWISIAIFKNQMYLLFAILYILKANVIILRSFTEWILERVITDSCPSQNLNASLLRYFNI